MQHASLPCPSVSPSLCSNSCALSRWCHPTISSSAIPFSSCPQSFPVLGSFLMRQLFASGDRSIWNFSFSISSSNEYSELISFRVDWFYLLAVQETLESLLQHHSSKIPILQHTTFFMIQLSHPYVTTGESVAVIMRTFVGQVMSLLFNMLSGFVIAFLPRSKSLSFSFL